MKFSRDYCNENVLLSFKKINSFLSTHCTVHPSQLQGTIELNFQQDTVGSFSLSIGEIHATNKLSSLPFLNTVNPFEHRPLTVACSHLVQSSYKKKLTQWKSLCPPFSAGFYLHLKGVTCVCVLVHGR